MWKFANFDLPHLHLGPPQLGVTPVEFRKEFWHSGLSCDVVCVILLMAVLVEHRLVTDTDTKRRTAIAYTAHSIHVARAVKIVHAVQWVNRRIPIAQQISRLFEPARERFPKDKYRDVRLIHGVVQVNSETSSWYVKRRFRGEQDVSKYPSLYCLQVTKRTGSFTCPTSTTYSGSLRPSKVFHTAEYTNYYQ